MIITLILTHVAVLIAGWILHARYGEKIKTILDQVL